MEKIAKKPAAKRTAKTVAPVAPVEIIETAQTDAFADVQAAFIDACEYRKTQPENAKCSTIIADLNAVKSAEFKRQLEHVVINGFSTPEALQALAGAIKSAPKGSDGYIALKVITKIRQCIYALATKQKSQLDGYTNSILFNLCKNQELTNKSGLMSLTRAVVYSEMDQVQHVRALLDVSIGTASTQLSSSRQMLRFLDICNVIKAKKNDAISFKDNERAHAIIAFYTAA